MSDPIEKLEDITVLLLILGIVGIAIFLVSKFKSSGANGAGVFSSFWKKLFGGYKDDGDDGDSEQKDKPESDPYGDPEDKELGIVPKFIHDGLVMPIPGDPQYETKVETSALSGGILSAFWAGLGVLTPIDDDSGLFKE